MCCCCSVGELDCADGEWCVHPGVGSLSSSHWELMGDAMVTTEQVRLTPDMQSRQGAVWSRIVSTYTFTNSCNLYYVCSFLICVCVCPALSPERLGDAGAL